MPKIKSGLLHYTAAAVFLLMFTFPLAESRAITVADDAQFTMFKPNSRIDNKVEASINAVLKRDKRSNKPPSMSDIAPLLEFLLVADGKGSNQHPAKRNEGMGIYWRGIIDTPFKDALRYFYNPDIPHELLYPASLRRGYWKEGSELLSLKKPLWEMLDTLDDTPLVLNGDEFEEITPDDSSGCYYIYTLNRVMVLLKYKGVPMLLSIGWQDGKSETGKKAYFLGDYANWDFVYTKDVGGTASGIGWMSTYIYNTCSITLIFPKSDGTTSYSMLKWLKAGWSGLNVVKRKHITAGADRNFTGMQAVIHGATSVKPEELEKISKKYDAYDRAAMLKEAAPYAQELAKLSKNDEILGRDEFQALLAGGKYAENLSDEELRSLLKVLALKRRLGKPVLGG